MPEYLPYVEPFFDLSMLAERLRHEDSVMLEYPVRDGNWHLARFIVQTRGKMARRGRCSLRCAFTAKKSAAKRT